MKKRFIVLVDGAPVTERNALTSFFKGKFSYWHHFADSWLLTTSNQDWDTAKIRDSITKLVPSASVLVLEVALPEKSPRWSSRAAATALNWVKSNWID